MNIVPCSDDLYSSHSTFDNALTAVFCEELAIVQTTPYDSRDECLLDLECRAYCAALDTLGRFA